MPRQGIVHLASPWRIFFVRTDFPFQKHLLKVYQRPKVVKTTKVTSLRVSECSEWSLLVIWLALMQNPLRARDGLLVQQTRYSSRGPNTMILSLTSQLRHLVRHPGRRYICRSLLQHLRTVSEKRATNLRRFDSRGAMLSWYVHVLSFITV